MVRIYQLVGPRPVDDVAQERWWRERRVPGDVGAPRVPTAVRRAPGKLND